MGRDRTIILTAKCCGKTVSYNADLDWRIPAKVVKIVQPSCDEHWNGDFEDETWLDASGNEVRQF